MYIIACAARPRPRLQAALVEAVRLLRAEPRHQVALLVSSWIIITIAIIMIIIIWCYH